MHAVATHVRFPPTRFQQRRDDPHRGRFSRPVRPDESEKIAGRQVQIDFSDSERVAVFLSQIDGLNHRFGPLFGKDKETGQGKSPAGTGGQ